MLDLLEGLIEATYRRELGPILRRVNLLLEKFRIEGEMSEARAPLAPKAFGNRGTDPVPLGDR